MHRFVETFGDRLFQGVLLDAPLKADNGVLLTEQRSMQVRQEIKSAKSGEPYAYCGGGWRRVIRRRIRLYLAFRVVGYGRSQPNPSRYQLHMAHSAGRSCTIFP
jgi:hypothetical protein